MAIWSINRKAFVVRVTIQDRALEWKADPLLVKGERNWTTGVQESKNQHKKSKRNGNWKQKKICAKIKKDFGIGVWDNRRRHGLVRILSYIVYCYLRCSHKLRTTPCVWLNTINRFLHIIEISDQCLAHAQ